MPAPSAANLIGLAFVFALAFLSRSWVRIFVIRKPYTADSLFHLRFIREVRRRGWKGARRDMRHDYPLGYHWLLSHLPQSWLEKWERYNGGVFDCLHICLFISVLYFFAPKNTPPSLVWFWGPLLLSFHPGWMYAGMGPRAYHLTERVLSEFLIGCAFSSLWVFAATGNWAWYALAALITGFSLTCSKFSLQVLVGFCPIMGALQLSIPIFFLPVLSIAVAWLITSGDYITQLRGQIIYSLWYAGAIRRREMIVWARNSWAGMMKRYHDFGKIGIAKWLAEECSFFITPLQHVPFLIALIAAAYGVGRLPHAIFARDWIIAAAAIWFLTSLKWFLVLGEAERYLYHATVPIYFFIVVWLGSGVLPAWKWVLLAYVLLWYAVQQGVILIRLRHNTIGEEFLTEREQLMAFLNELPIQRYLAFSKSHALTGEVMYFTDHVHPEIEIYNGKQYTFDEIFSVFPFPRWSIIDEVDVSLLVVNKPEVEAAEKQGIGKDYDFKKTKKVFESKTYAVYSVLRARGGS